MIEGFVPGQRVAYVPLHARARDGGYLPHAECLWHPDVERGVVVRCNPDYGPQGTVFVKFDGDVRRQGTWAIAKGCDPSDLLVEEQSCKYDAREVQ